MNKYAINKVIDAMEIELKECFVNIVKTTHSYDGSIINLKQNLSDIIYDDTKIRELLEKYLEE